MRQRLIKAVLADRALTTAQLAAELNDVPVGSLYRHIALLTTAGVLQAVAERRVRGTGQGTYTLGLCAARIQPGQAAARNSAEHSRALMASIAELLSDFDCYLAAGPPDRSGTAPIIA